MLFTFTLKRCASITFLLLFTITASAQTPLADADTLQPGVLIEGYQLDKDYDKLVQLVPGQTPNKAYIVPEIFFWHPWHEGFNGLENQFLLFASGYLNVTNPGEYSFKLWCDDGAKLYINDQLIINNDGVHPVTVQEGSAILNVGLNRFRIEYFQAAWWKALMLEWAPPGQSFFSTVPSTAFLHQPAVLVTSPGIKRVLDDTQRPGNGLPLAELHPSYDVATVREQTFKPAVSGMDFLSDGRLVISTFGENNVYVVENIQNDGPYHFKQIASGLSDPLGLKVIDDEIFIIEKGRLLKLVDHDGDDVADEYRTVSSGWGNTGNFHEFENGLVYDGSYLYATLTVAIDFFGNSSSNQHPDRGKVIKIDPETGDYTFVASGLRSPNGVGTGATPGVYVTDNQGDWLPANKLIYVQEGAFYGHRDVDPVGTAGLEVTPPVLLLPHGDIANSPGQPVPMYDEPYRGQMLFGDVTYGGITRAFVEEVNGVKQGAAFRFTQGLEAGINRAVWGPDGALYLGGIGGEGNWGQPGKLKYGLQRLKYNGKAVFDLLAVRARTDGFEMEFTQPLPFGVGETDASYQLRQWTYNPTTDYGGAPVDEGVINVKAVHMDGNRRRVFIETGSQAKKGYVMHVRVRDDVVNSEGTLLWNAEAWYTLNEIPASNGGVDALSRDNPALAITPPPTSKAANAAYAFKVYPNPITSVVTIDCSDSQLTPLEALIINEQGTTVAVVPLQGLGDQRYLVPMTAIDAGLYYLQIRSAEGKVSSPRRLLKK